MEPFDASWLPSSGQSLGTAGLLVSVVGATLGTVWLVAYDGRIPSFVFIALCAVLGWVSFMLRWPYEQSPPPSG